MRFSVPERERVYGTFALMLIRSVPVALIFDRAWPQTSRAQHVLLHDSKKSCQNRSRQPRITKPFYLPLCA
jgi:hypothetical protein